MPLVYFQKRKSDATHAIFSRLVGRLGVTIVSGGDSKDLCYMPLVRVWKSHILAMRGGWFKSEHPAGPKIGLLV